MQYIYLAQLKKINTIITCVHFRYNNLINKTLCYCGGGGSRKLFFLRER